MNKLLLISHLLISHFVFAQINSEINDKFSLKRVLATGSLRASARQFSMFTQNHRGLTNYYGVAVGGGLRYETKRWRNLQFGFGGYFVNDVVSSEFTQTDPTTKASSRYDSGLYDITGVEDKSFLSRVEELNVKYYLLKKSKFIFGKQILRTPLVNPQDGRMTPSMMEGIYLEFDEIKNLHIEGGWMYKSSPRSTFKWFGVGHSIGLYPVGVNADGAKNKYQNSLKTKGLFVFGANYSVGTSSKLILWNYLIQNISNTVMLQLNQDLGKFKFGLQSFYQKSVGDGGNQDPTLQYLPRGSESVVFGGMASRQIGSSNLQLNYTRITKKGKFLFPREWGREPFFTFLARERSEGLGDINAFTINWGRFLATKKIKLELGLGYYDLPDVKNFAMNKYGIPSYTQLNFDIRYKFSKAFEGLEAQLLVAKKWNMGNIYNDEKYRINKVDMTNYNLVLNYSFEIKP
ncbi:MAG: OprD family porin [Spirosomaceae bacterium]|jgi:hypothetical protein|nr:OprD family porin [Spirosomataceae bacterium]